jgi:hypothetical protein
MAYATRFYPPPPSVGALREILVKAKILTGYLSSIIDVEIKHFDDFNDHKTVLKDIESKVTFAINMLKTIQN